MDEMFICKICKKVFTGQQSLNKHKMSHHSSSKDIPHQFRNSNSISITRIPPEPTNVVQSAAIMQNQNSFRRMASPPGASQVGNVRRVEQVKGTPRNNQDIRIKNAAVSLTSMASELDGDDQYKKWDPPQRDKDNRGANTDGTIQIITPSAAERATSAFCIPPANPRGKPPGKGPPQLLRMGGASNGKRPVPGVASPAQRTNAVKLGSVRGDTKSPLDKIMNNLGKIKSMNAQANRPNPKLISAPAKVVQQLPKQKPQIPVQPFRVTKPPQVSKNKNFPRNAANNALPKPGVQKAPPLKVANEVVNNEGMDVEGASDDELTYPEPPKLQANSQNLSQTKPSLAPGGGASAGGKMLSPKTLSANRFNPMGSPKANANNTSRNGNSSNATMNQQGGSSGLVVAKKSAPGGAKNQSYDDKIKMLKRYVPSMPGKDYEMPTLTAVGTYTNRKGEQVWVCLVCNDKESEESSRDMICCDTCEDWYHWECVGIMHSMPEDDPWYCKRCIYQASGNPSRDFPKLFPKGD